MIHFKTIRWQNFLSTGNQWTEVELDSGGSSLIVGENGAGKCVRRSTEINVSFDDSETQKKFEEYIKKSTKTTVGCVADFYSAYPECVGNIKVATRNGYKQIEYADITAFDSIVIKVCLSNDIYLESSPDHRLMGECDVWVKVRDLKIGDRVLTVDGMSDVVSIEKLNFTEDLYDLQVDGQEYYTNGVVSHNSTLLDALTFVLFGKAFRDINKPQLTNTITKRDLLVEIEFVIGKNSYIVRRGIKPNVFEVLCNEILMNQPAETRDYQEVLEKQILKSNYKTFCQVDILGSASFIPFMQLSASQRRSVIEDLLDLQVFSAMNILLKERIGQNGADINSNEYKRKLVDAKIKLVNEHLQDLQKNNQDFVREKKVTLVSVKAQRDAENQTLGVLRAELVEAQNLLESIDGGGIEARYRDISEARANFSEKSSNLNKELTFFQDHKNCPTCKQSISQDFRCQNVDLRATKIQELQESLEKLDRVEQKNDEKHKSYRLQLRVTTDLRNDILTASTNINHMDRRVSDIEIEIEQTQNEVASKSDLKVIDLEKELLKISKEFNDLQEERQVFSYASGLLKDGGIKTKIINQYIPVINKLINKYLSAMDFFVDFQLNGQFEESIKSRYRDEFSYSSFSEGEKQRIDLALLFTWRAVAKLRNSMSTNLLILDEVFDSSLDANSTEMLMQILNTIGDDCSLFVISHKEHLNDRFANVIRFVKHKNFSRIEGQ